MSALEIMLRIYRGLIAKTVDDMIPVKLRAKRLVGTVQDDPFDCWMQREIKCALPLSFEVMHSGALTTPDIVVRDKTTGRIVGIEVKKLIQQQNGRDPRGMTLDYNSCLPCGSTMVKVGNETIVVPCFYIFALLSSDIRGIVTLIILDGDFINYDFDLHKEAKYANYTEYNHGPYGEGSVRHRKMYTYPNPLNSQIKPFFSRHILVAKKSDFMALGDECCHFTDEVVREDKFGNAFHYYLDDESRGSATPEGALIKLTGIFDFCKIRQPKERVAAIPVLREL